MQYSSNSPTDIKFTIADKQKRSSSKDFGSGSRPEHWIKPHLNEPALLDMRKNLNIVSKTNKIIKFINENEKEVLRIRPTL